MSAEMLYTTMTGRVYDLIGSLSAAEFQVYTEVHAQFELDPPWDAFARMWLGHIRMVQRQVHTQSVLWRVCQDMEMRLGVRQGKVAPPDYRDAIFDRIAETGCRWAEFCHKLGMDSAVLSRILSGKDHDFLKALFTILKELGFDLFATRRVP